MDIGFKQQKIQSSVIGFPFSTLTIHVLLPNQKQNNVNDTLRKIQAPL